MKILCYINIYTITNMNGQLYNAAELGVADLLRQKVVKQSKKGFKSKETIAIVVADAIDNMILLQSIGTQAQKLTGETTVSNIIAKTIGTTLVLQLGHAMGLVEDMSWQKALMKTGTDYILQYGVDYAWKLIPGVPMAGANSTAPPVSAY